MTDQPIRRYLFALADGGGTVPPELGLVGRLVARGHDVTVIVEDSMLDDARRTGATLRTWRSAPNRASRHPDDDPYRDWECRSPLALIDRLLEHQLVGPAPGYAIDAATAIADVDPDLVVCSFFALGAMAAAEAAGRPFDVLFPNVYLLPAPGIPPFGLGLAPARGALGRLRDRALSAVITRQWNRGLPGLNALRSQLGLGALASLFDQVHHARRELVLTSPEFDFPGDVPANVRYVGPILDDPAWAHQAPRTAPDPALPLVLVALSSTFQDQVGCLQRIVDGLAELPVRAIVTTGPAIDPDAITTRGPIEVVRAAPHSAILDHAAAVVTHGGHGTVVRSLAAGVPMVVLPHGRDQADNARRITTRHAGLALKRSARPAQIAGAVQRVLDDPTMRTAAERLGAALRRDAASDLAVTELESTDATPRSLIA